MLNFWDYMVIALYVVALVVVGWLASKKVKNAKDYISANRGLGIIVMIGSLAGAAAQSVWPAMSIPRASAATGRLSAGT